MAEATRSFYDFRFIHFSTQSCGRPFLSAASVCRAIFETSCPGMRLQIWRSLLNCDPVGLILFFIPCRVAGLQCQSNTFFQFPVGWL